MRLFNTLTRQVEDFVPLRDNTVRMYTCGLTVYNRGHIGNFRTFVSVDVLRRALKYVGGFKMHHVMNFTDVDDKTIVGSSKAGMPLREYTDQYISAFRQDALALGIEPVEDTPRATDSENLQAMADMINTSRLSNGMRAAGLMRRALTEALFVARNRKAFGRALVDLPLMRRQLLKLMLPAEAARSFMFYTAEELRKADAGDENARRRVRLLTPLIKFRACRAIRRRMKYFWAMARVSRFPAFPPA